MFTKIGYERFNDIKKEDVWVAYILDDIAPISTIKIINQADGYSMITDNK